MKKQFALVMSAVTLASPLATSVSMAETEIPAKADDSFTDSSSAVSVSSVFPDASHDRTKTSVMSYYDLGTLKQKIEIGDGVYLKYDGKNIHVFGKGTLDKAKFRQVKPLFFATARVLGDRGVDRLVHDNVFDKLNESAFSRIIKPDVTLLIHEGVSLPEDSSGLFEDLLCNLDISIKADFSNIKKADKMFKKGVVISSLDMTGRDFSGIVSAKNMFEDCYLFDSSFENTHFAKTSNLKNAFLNCHSLSTLNMDAFGTDLSIYSMGVPYYTKMINKGESLYDLPTFVGDNDIIYPFVSTKDDSVFAKAVGDTSSASTETEGDTNEGKSEKEISTETEDANIKETILKASENGDSVVSASGLDSKSESKTDAKSDGESEKDVKKELTASEKAALKRHEELLKTGKGFKFAQELLGYIADIPVRKPIIVSTATLNEKSDGFFRAMYSDLDATKINPETFRGYPVYVGPSEFSRVSLSRLDDKYGSYIGGEVSKNTRPLLGEINDIAFKRLILKTYPNSKYALGAICLPAGDYDVYKIINYDEYMKDKTSDKYKEFVTVVKSEMNDSGLSHLDISAFTDDNQIYVIEPHGSVVPDVWDKVNPRNISKLVLKENSKYNPDDLLKCIKNLPEGSAVRAFDDIDTSVVSKGSIPVLVSYRNGLKEMVNVPYEIEPIVALPSHYTPVVITSRDFIPKTFKIGETLNLDDLKNNIKGIDKGIYRIVSNSPIDTSKPTKGMMNLTLVFNDGKPDEHIALPYEVKGNILPEVIPPVSTVSMASNVTLKEDEEYDYSKAILSMPSGTKYKVLQPIDNRYPHSGVMVYKFDFPNGTSRIENVSYTILKDPLKKHNFDDFKVSGEGSELLSTIMDNNKSTGEVIPVVDKKYDDVKKNDKEKVIKPVVLKDDANSENKSSDKAVTDKVSAETVVPVRKTDSTTYYPSENLNTKDVLKGSTNAYKSDSDKAGVSKTSSESVGSLNNNSDNKVSSLSKETVSASPTTGVSTSLFASVGAVSTTLIGAASLYIRKKND